MFLNYFFRHLFEEETNLSGGQVTEGQTAAAVARDGLDREGTGNTAWSCLGVLIVNINPVI